jgi:hypothetical protein
MVVPVICANRRDRLVERAARDRADQPVLTLVAPQPAGQLELGVERMDRLMTWRSVSNPGDADLAEQGDQRPGVQPLVRQARVPQLA